MNQVKFLGLAHVFVTVSPSEHFKTFYAKPAQKRYGYLSGGYLSGFKNFTVVREVLCNKYRSHNLVGHYHF